MNSTKLKTLVFSAIYTALIFIFTFFFHITFPLVGGYIHLGDSMIFLAASSLSSPLAMAAAAIGAGLSDLSLGFVVYIIPTVIVKSLCAFCFTNKNDKFLCKRNIIAAFICIVITLLGYGVAEWIITGVFTAAIATFAGNAVQAISNAVFYIVIAYMLDAANFKTRFKF